jgi:hypothetical protein
MGVAVESQLLKSPTKAALVAPSAKAALSLNVVLQTGLLFKGFFVILMVVFVWRPPAVPAPMLTILLQRTALQANIPIFAYPIAIKKHLQSFPNRAF